MKILKIEHLKKTDDDDFTEITFKTWWGKVFTRKCITPNYHLHTDYARSGNTIPTYLWSVVVAFIKTGDKVHTY